MPSNKLSVLFDRRLRPSKSISNLLQVTSTEDGSGPSLRRTKSKEHLSVLVEYKFEQYSLLPHDTSSPPPLPPPKDDTRAATIPAVTMKRSVSPLRAGTTPMIHPPDELFLKLIRRRSANARLEEQRVSNGCRHIYGDNDIETSVAIAYALPPQYFDLPPKYESPQQMEPIPRLRSRGTITKSKQPELFLDDALSLQIDQVIADFGGYRLTEATPVQSATSSLDDVLVSPINEIDHIYLERRRQMKRQHEQQEQYPLNTVRQGS